MRSLAIFPALLALFCSPSSAQSRQASHVNTLTIPDGRWWLAATFDEKFGFLQGEEDCFIGKVRRGWFVNEPGVAANFGRNNYYNRIDEEIRRNPGLVKRPITTTIRRVLKYHRKPTERDRLLASRGHDFSGGGFKWSNLGDYDERRGYVYGYVTCKHIYLGYRPKLTVGQIERRVSSTYGLTGKYARDDYQPAIRNRHRKLAEIIDKM